MSTSSEAHAKFFDPEDHDLIEKLAKLQSMYDQIFELRTLLPERLIRPTRNALEDPLDFSPEKFAVQLRETARTGSKDIKKFKHDWHGEQMRELWSKVNVSEFPQGLDAWEVDYPALLRHFQDGTLVDMNRDRKEIEATTGEGESAVEIVKAFREVHPEVAVKVFDDGDGVVLEVEVAQTLFKVVPGDGPGPHYRITTEMDGSGTELMANVVQSINEGDSHQPLSQLLNLLTSYHNIKSRPCDKCQRLFDHGLQLPMIRELHNNADPSKSESWSALHPACASTRS